MLNRAKGTVNNLAEDFEDFDADFGDLGDMEF